MKKAILYLAITTCFAVFAQGQNLDSMEIEIADVPADLVDTTLQKIEDLTKVDDTLNINRMLPDSLSQKLNFVDNVKDSLDDQLSSVEHAKDTLLEVKEYLNHLTDSLDSFQKISELEQFQADLIDSLRIFNLPEEIDHYLDSLSKLPNFHEKIIMKLGKGDTSKNRTIVLEKVSELLIEEQTALTNDVLPEDFTKLITKYKSSGDVSEWANKASELVNIKQLEFTNLKQKIDLNNLMNNDLDFINKLKLDGGDLSGKAGNITTEVGNLKEIVDIESLKGDMDGKEIGEYADILDKVDTEEYNKLVREYGSLSEDELDQRIDEQLIKMSETQEVQKQTSALEIVQKDHLAKMEQLRKQQKVIDKIAQKKDRILANDIISENKELVEKAQVQTNKLIGKYVKIEKGTDWKDGKKVPKDAKGLGKRFVYGGNLQLIPGENISLDLSPFLAYKIDRLWIAGAGGTFRYEFQKDEKYLPDFQKEPIYGYRIFMQYKVISDFFAHGEWERLSVYDKNLNKRWENNYLAGIGKEITLKKNLGFVVMLLYNIKHKDNESYTSPFILRMGLKSK